MVLKVNIDFFSLIFLSSLLNTIRLVRFAVCVLLLNLPVLADEYQEYEMLNITAGQVGILDDLDGSQRYGLEYRFKSFSGPWDFRLIPAVGAAISNNGAGFIYTDLRHDFYLNRRMDIDSKFWCGNL